MYLYWNDDDIWLENKKKTERIHTEKSKLNQIQPNNEPPGIECFCFPILVPPP